MSKVFDGKKAAEEVYDNMKNEVEALKLRGITPKLAIIVVGSDRSSKIFVNKKVEAAGLLGIETEKHELPDDVSEDALSVLISEVAKKVDGIIVQLPLPPRINVEKIISVIPPEKDVDGFSPLNMGRTLRGDEAFAPCVVKAILRFFDSERIELAGKRVVVISRSSHIGKPLAMTLLARDATVTICHSKTENLGKICKESDVLIAAAGVPGLVRPDMVREGSIVVDVGITRQGIKIKGDVDDEVKDIASVFSPVPGGIGPLTVAMAISSLVLLAKRNHDTRR